MLSALLSWVGVNRPRRDPNPDNHRYEIPVVSPGVNRPPRLDADPGHCCFMSDPDPDHHHPHILEEIPDSDHHRHIPDEILEEIFSRLPTKDVVRFGGVCRRWRALMSTQRFAVMHFGRRRASSRTVLVETVEIQNQKQNYNNNIGDWFLQTLNGKKRLHSFDGWRRRRRQPAEEGGAGEERRRFLEPESEYRHVDDGDGERRKLMMSFSSSCGLTVFHQFEANKSPIFSSYFAILNPLTREKVEIRVPDHIGEGQVYGLFFHPRVGEFCVLWGELSAKYDGVLQFQLLNLGPSPSRWRKVGGDPLVYRHQPRRGPSGIFPPVVVIAPGGDDDDRDHVMMYWIVGDGGNYTALFRGITDPGWPDCCREAILSFDVDREEFGFLPHPGPCCDTWVDTLNVHPQMRLMEKGVDAGGLHHLSSLTLCESTSKFGIFNIWEWLLLPQQRAGVWIKTHNVNLFNNNDRQLHNCSSRYFDPIGMFLDDDDDGTYLLLVYWTGVGLLVHDLRRCTSRLFEKSIMFDDDDKDGGVLISAHTHAFVAPHKGMVPRRN